ncbi:hypothetical protein DN402_33655 [Streptomyces sp. SW4]|nr:hypothetical protein DN402_33655 [Streptomyces sp. SW4]
MKRTDRMRRAAGAVVGSAVGDALGAPFEFGPQGAFSARFPAPGRVARCAGAAAGTPARPPTTRRWPSWSGSRCWSGADWICRTSSPASSGGRRRSPRTSACRPRTC